MRAVLDDDLVEGCERAVAVEECCSEVWSTRPGAGGEPYEVAAGEVVTRVFEVDHGDFAGVGKDVARGEVEVARYGW